MKYLDLRDQLIEFVGTPSEFAVGDRVLVVSGPYSYSGSQGGVIGFQIHSVGEPKDYFLLPIIKLDAGPELTAYPFSVRKLDPIAALARLGR